MGSFRPPVAPLLLAALLAPSAAMAAGTPVVVAVDTSRSLTQAELAETTELLARTVAGLPADTPVGALEFNDAAHWLVRPGGSREQVMAALRRLRPAGDFTVLFDGLFTAARALPGGGAILLATDGLDENSATTAEDVARLCTANDVRIVAVASGHRINERGLRRLALLTNGSYVAARGSAVGAALGAALASVRQAPPKAPPAPPTAAPTTATPPPPAAAQPRRARSLGWLPLIVGVVAGVILLAFVLWRRQSAEQQRRVCPRCGSPLEDWETECPHCSPEEDLGGAAPASSAAPRDDLPPILDPAVFAKQPLAETLEKTFVLGEQPVLVVKEHRKPPRSFLLSGEQPFTVGRAPTVNTLTLADPTLSGQHFRIVSQDGEFYVVDLETTNGTLVNGQRVRAQRLEAGDVIRAGEVEFEFRVQYQKKG
jgi:FHA domain/von Willebrand factor type A domain